jgi:3-phenylpropionate/trans-cinnamate dioxygenase ferredoxin reductase subunit
MRRHYRYLIIGGGLAADAAVMGIRAGDETGTIALISEEPYPPYRRPMLSKSLWRGTPLEEVWLPTADAGVSIQTGIRAVSLDLNAKCVWDAQGNQWGFEKLLLATGCAPRTLPQASGEMVYFRTLGDYFTLREQLDGAERVGIIGGGYIGSELGAALALNRKRVTMLFPESGICARLFPPVISDWLNDFYRAQGVEVLSGVLVEAVERTKRWQVRLSDGCVQAFDALVAGLGVQPRDELAKQAGLDAPNGIRVNPYFQTSHPDVYAAGDVALFPYGLLGIETRVEHEDHAIASGFYAGQAMAGAAQPYEHIPMFYSELFDIRYEAVGLIDSQLETRLEGALPEGAGIITYYQEGRLVGALSWRGACPVDELREMLRRVHFNHPAAPPRAARADSDALSDPA